MPDNMSTDAQTTVVLEISNPQNYFTIPIHTLEYPPSQVSAKNYTAIESITVKKSIFKPKLIANWGRLTLQVLSNEYTVPLPRQVPISIFLQNKLYNVLKHERFQTRILLTAGKFLITIPLAEE